jgi:hypothetical protein
LPAPQEHDYEAAESYLSLLETDASLLAGLVEQLKASAVEPFAAKDILRASGLPALAPDNPHVADDLRKIKDKEPLSPVLLVRGSPLTIADGYHRVCAAWHADEDAEVPCLTAVRPATS